MAVKRQGNFLGQQRVDVPHLRSIESSVCGDFDSLAGKALAGGSALVVAGFTLSNVSVGQPAINMLLNVASGIMLHATASESGTIFTVAAGEPAESFLSSNAKVSGSFSPGTTNYIGLDLVRNTDDTTTDVVRFLSASTDAEYTQTVPLAQVLSYVIVVTNSDFAANPSLIPIAKVVTDASNNIDSAVVDCRQMMFRLGTGGTTPDIHESYSWLDANRNETLSADIFTGGDKDIASQAEWNRAVMSRLWELGGGEFWYSPTADRNVKLNGDPTALFPGGENFAWESNAADNLWWSGLRIVFDNSTAWYNTIDDVLADNAGGPGVYGAGFTDLTLDGDCVYVDIDRTAIVALTAYKGNMASLGSPTVPGSRFVVAFRSYNAIWTPLSPFAVGSGGVAHATAGTYGSVRLAASAGNVVPPDDAYVPGYEVNTHTVIARRISRFDASPIGVGAGTLSIGTVAAFDTALSFATAGVTSTFFGRVDGQQGVLVTNSVVHGFGGKFTGNGTGQGLWGIAGAATDSIGVYGTASDGWGVYGGGGGAHAGVEGASTAYHGVVGRGSWAAMAGVYGKGEGLGGYGIWGEVGANADVAIWGDGSGHATGTGVKGKGKGTGYGIWGILGATGTIAIYGDGTGATTDGTGVKGIGKGAGHGIHGLAGAGTGHGVFGDGGTGTGYGVLGAAPVSGGAAVAYAVWGDGTTATFNGTGVYGKGKGTGYGVFGDGSNSTSVNATGVYGTGKGDGDGVLGEAGVNFGYGVRGIVSSGATHGYGMAATGKGDGDGIYATGGVNGRGATLAGGTNAPNVALVPHAKPTAAVASGDVYFDSTEKAPFFYDGTRWNQMGDGRIVRTSDVAISTNPTLGDSGLGFACATSGVYTFELTLWVDMDASAGGWEGDFLAIGGLTATNFYASTLHIEGDAYAAAGAGVTEDSGVNSTRYAGHGVAALSTPFDMAIRAQTVTTLYHIRGTITANVAGSLSFHFRPKVNTFAVTIRKGSHIQWRRHF